MTTPSMNIPHGESTSKGSPSMERDGLIGRILHRVDPLVTASSMEADGHAAMEADMHLWMRISIYG